MNDLGGVIIFQSGPATGKTLLPRLILNQFNLSSGHRTILLQEGVTEKRLYSQVLLAGEGVIIIDEIQIGNHSGLRSLINVITRKDQQSTLFILLTQSELPPQFYEIADFCWELKPIR